MPRQYTPRVARACIACGAAMLIMPSRIAKGRGEYCGRICARASVTTHGESSPRSVEYRTWKGIRTRCLNPTARAYPMYGGRGITVCETWRDNFEAFLADVGRRPSAVHSIDRIDNAKGYEPGNVRWATRVVQANNRRGNRPLTFGGVTRGVGEWANLLGINTSVLLGRLNRGWPVERALTTPPDSRRGHRNKSIGTKNGD